MQMESLLRNGGPLRKARHTLCGQLFVEIGVLRFNVLLLYFYCHS